MLLVRIKLQDDWDDDRSLASRLALRVFAKPIRRSHEYFRSLDQDFHATLSSILLAHQRLEQNRGAVSLEQFQSATRAGFAYIFGLFAKRWLDQSTQSDFERIGGELGAAIIAFDCATDWKADQRRGRYNPLMDSAEISQAYLECGRCLSRASWLCQQLATVNSEQPLIADQIVRRWLTNSLQLAEQREFFNLPVAKRSSRARLPQTPLRLRSHHALRRGDCDICCVVEACDVVSCCDPVCCDRTCCQSDKKKSKQHIQSANSPFIRQSSETNLSGLLGSRGLTCGLLNPAGLVTIANIIYPASSQSGLYFDAGEEVTVVGIDSFGLKVNPTM
jgi:hypothetical protein